MADEATAEVKYDWSKINGSTADRLRAPKIIPVPAHIVKLAQASYDDGEVKKYRFPDGTPEKVVEEFAEHLKNAGLHTEPNTSVQPVIDPENEGDLLRIHWKAGLRRGAHPKK